MSADSTELTFVRCPSCRSLVPAVSTRCRMCGSAIDAQGKDAGDGGSPKRSRSNTMAQPNTEFVDASEAVRKAAGESVAVSGTGNSDEGEEFDPLRDYLEQDEPAAASTPPSQPTAHATSSAPNGDAGEKIESAAEPKMGALEEEEDGFDIFGDDDDDDWLDDIIDEPVVEKETKRSEAASAVVSPTREDQVINKDRTPAPAHFNGGRTKEATAVEKEAPRVVVESGGRAAGKPSGLSFGKSRGAGEAWPKKGEVAPATGRPSPIQQREVRPAKVEPQRAQDQRSDRFGRKELTPSTPPVPTRDLVDSKKENQSARRTSAPATKERVYPVRPPQQEGVDARLVGWLVSFSTPTRFSIELREGKFFVGGTSLKPNDLVLDDPSVSTPHALIAVGADRLQVQDLMSEGGVFRRQQGEREFVQYGEPFDLCHGDWVRFGQVDFLVTMIPIDHEE